VIVVSIVAACPGREFYPARHAKQRGFLPARAVRHSIHAFHRSASFVIADYPVPQPTPQRISLIGAPTDVGAGRRGASMGPEALRVAGLKRALERLNHSVIDRGNLAGPINPEAPRVSGYRHLSEVTAWCVAVRDAVYAALGDG